jgi:hypothetical protein
MFFKDKNSKLNDLLTISSFEKQIIINITFITIDKYILQDRIEINFEDIFEDLTITAEDITYKEIKKNENISNIDTFLKRNSKTISRKEFIDLFKEKNKLFTIPTNETILQYLAFISSGKTFFIGINNPLTPKVLIPEIINYFDSAIEKIEENSPQTFNIKFKNQEAKTVNDENLASLLSCGTSKGIILFEKISKVLKLGSYLFIDEIELGLHKTIVSDIIKIFYDRRINPLGATLIFSTHYIEILDLLRRNDSLYLLSKNTGITQIINYSSFDIRGEKKKSKVLSSNELNIHSNPQYTNFLQLQSYLIKENEKRE